MYPDEMIKIEEAFDFLDAATVTPPRRPTVILAAGHVETIIQVLERWPSLQRFPGMSSVSEYVSWA